MPPKDNPTNPWMPIESAPTDGTLVWVYVEEKDGLRSFETFCSYHPDAGWCADEIRKVTHWQKPIEVGDFDP